MTARIVIGTPMLDWSVGGNHHASMWQLLRHDKPDWTILDPKILVGCDLVRARSRIVRIFLQETDGTHLLFLDADVACTPSALSGMIACEVDAIGCAYPKKHIDAYGRSVDLAVVRDPFERVETGCRSVLAIGAGCLLLTRELLEEMSAGALGHATPGMPVIVAEDEGVPTPMLFALLVKNGVLLPEDYSFCDRVRAYTRLWQYTGATLQHEGHHIFVADGEHE